MTRSEITELRRREKWDMVRKNVCLVLERASLPSNVEICTICAPRFSERKPEQFFYQPDGQRKRQKNCFKLKLSDFESQES